MSVRNGQVTTPAQLLTGSSEKIPHFKISRGNGAIAKSQTMILLNH